MKFQKGFARSHRARWTRASTQAGKEESGYIIKLITVRVQSVCGAVRRWPSGRTTIAAACRRSYACRDVISSVAQAPRGSRKWGVAEPKIEIVGPLTARASSLAAGDCRIGRRNGDLFEPTQSEVRGTASIVLPSAEDHHRRAMGAGGEQMTASLILKRASASGHPASGYQPLQQCFLRRLMSQN
jgi:hypothetical protein